MRWTVLSVLASILELYVRDRLFLAQFSKLLFCAEFLFAPELRINKKNSLYEYTTPTI